MPTETPHMPPGSLVKARGRDWVVIPSDEDGLVKLRPVDGVDDDAVGVYLPLEEDAVSGRTRSGFVVKLGKKYRSGPPLRHRLASGLRRPWGSTTSFQCE